MKKILSLLTALTLTASAATSVVSCANKNPGTGDQDKANDIAGKLMGKSVEVGKIDGTTKASDYKTKIQEALNKVVKQTPTAYSFEFDGSGDTPLSLKKTAIKIKIDVNGKKSKTISINITLVETDQQKANDIAGKLMGKSVEVGKIDGKTLASDYKTKIQEALNKVVKQTPTAYSFDFATDTDRKKTLSSTDTTTINIKIYVNSTSSNSISIQVKLNESDQQKANAVKNKIDVNKVLSLNFLDQAQLNTNDPITTHDIITELSKVNNLTDIERGYIRIDKNQIIKSQYAPDKTSLIDIKIVVGKTTLTVNGLKVHYSDYNDAVTAIKAKITDSNIDLKAVGNDGSSYKIGDANEGLRNAIKNENTTLTTTEISYLHFNDKTIANGATEVVTAYLFDKNKPAYKITPDFNVTFTDIDISQLLKDQLQAKFSDKKIKLDKTIFDGTTDKGLVNGNSNTQVQDAIRGYFTEALTQRNQSNVRDLTALTIEELNKVSFEWTGTLTGTKATTIKVTGASDITGYSFILVDNPLGFQDSKMKQYAKGFTLLPFDKRTTAPLVSSKSYNKFGNINQITNLDPMANQGGNPSNLWSILFWYYIKETVTGPNGEYGGQYFDYPNLMFDWNNDSPGISYWHDNFGGLTSKWYGYITPMTFDGKFEKGTTGTTTTTPVEFTIRKMVQNWTTPIFNEWIRTIINVKITWN